MIINIRGTSGSGKTYFAKSFMEACGNPVEVLHDNRVVATCVYYRLMPVYFIGSYRNVCGGCDTIKTQDMACSLVRHFSQFGHVIFEGLLMSHLYARYAALYDEMVGYGERFIFAFLDTPLDLCLVRIKERRRERGNLTELNPDNTISKYNSTMDVAQRFKADGFDVRWLRHEVPPVRQLERLLNLQPELTFEQSYREDKFR